MIGVGHDSAIVDVDAGGGAVVSSCSSASGVEEEAVVVAAVAGVVVCFVFVSAVTSNVFPSPLMMRPCRI